MPAPTEGFLWMRPLGLWGLALPVLLFLLSRLRARPRSLATGTLFLWKEVARVAPQRTRRATCGTTPATWIAIAALACGALALAGPTVVRPEAPRTWSLVIDRSPSMFLPLDAGDAGSDDRRIDAAVRVACERVSALAGPDDRVRWFASGRAPLELDVGARPPAEWWTPPAWFEVEPDWTLHDAPGVIAVTDREPDAKPEHAGWSASGGGAVHGTIATFDGERVEWDGTALTTRPDASPPRVVSFVAPANVESGAVEPLYELARVWAHARGLDFDESGARASSAALVVSIASADLAPDADGTFVAGRDRWTLACRVAARSRAADGDDRALRGASGVGPGDAWLVGIAPDGARGAERALVVGSPGVVRVAWSAMDEPRGDTAAFAVSWSRLFERWTRPASGVVPLAERRDAGAADVRDPVPPPPVEREEGERPAGADLASAWLAGAAAALACAASIAFAFGRR